MFKRWKGQNFSLEKIIKDRSKMYELFNKDMIFYRTLADLVLDKKIKL